MNHAPGRLPVTVLASFLSGGKTKLLNHLSRDREGKRVAATPIGSTSVVSSAAVSDHPSVFERIFADAVTVCIWNRQPDPILTNYLRESAGSGSWERRVRIEVASPQFEELLTGFKADLGRVRWVTELSALVDLFATLTDARTVGLRVIATDRATCPRFHSDQVGLRLLCSWLGEGTEWLAGGVVRRMRPFAVGVFKGELWPENQGRGAMHRSPQPIRRRVFVSLDEL